MTEEDAGKTEIIGGGQTAPALSGNALHRPGDHNKQAEWTIMVYMAGDNNLAENCIDALAAMKRALNATPEIDPASHINLIAQIDPGDTRVRTRRLVINLRTKPIPSGLTVPDEPVSSSELTKDSVGVDEGAKKFYSTNQANQPILPNEDGLETDSSDPKTLFDFISWSTEHYGAKRYMLVLDGHSAGIEQGYLLRDENPAKSMELAGLKQVLSAVKERLGITLDILGMDSCLMSMAEICFEFRGLVRFLVGAQGTVPNPGWPYERILNMLKSEKGCGDLDARDFAAKIVPEYINSYVEDAVLGGLATDLSALDVDASAGVVTAITELTGALTGKLADSVCKLSFRNALVLAHWEAQSYNGELFVDLYDFCYLLAKHLQSAIPTDPAPDNDHQKQLANAIEIVQNACSGVMAAVKAMVVKSCFCGIDCQYSNGVSIYFPWSTIFAYYQLLRFAQPQPKGAGWYDYLKEYVEGTRRKPRGEEDRDTEIIGPREDYLLTSRKVPDVDHGPAGFTNSMRNPPRQWSKNGISDCITDKPDLEHLFDTFR